MSGAALWSSRERCGWRAGTQGPGPWQKFQEWPAFVEPAAGADCRQPPGVTAQVYSFRNA